VAALTVTLAAGLCVMAAHRSVRQLPQAAQLAAQAQGLRDRAAPLAQADAEGYRAVLAARRARDPAVAAALAEASEVPMQVARIGARVAGLARQIAAGGNPAVHGDAVAAALLAAAAARTSAVLVRANLAEPADTRPADTRRADTRRADAGPADARIARAQQDADEATAQAREAEGRPRDGKETVRGPE
jgi:formiminotetrahydrofolate cyclodeaminase